MILLCLIAAVAYISLGLPDTILGVAWPSLRRDYGVPLDSLGLLLAITFAGYLLSSSLAGRINRYLSIGQLLVASSALMGLVLVGFGAGSNFPLLLLLGFLGGCGGGAIDATLNSVAAHHFSLRVVNWLHGCWGIGAFIGPVLMTWLLANGHAWRWGYYVIAAALAATTALLWFTRRRWDALSIGPTVAPKSNNTSGANNASEADPPAAVASLKSHPLLDRDVRQMCLLFFIYCGIESSIGQLFFTWWTEGRQLSTARGGGAIAGFWLTFTIGRFALGQLMRWVSGRHLIDVVTVLIPITIAVIACLPNPAHAIPCLVLLGGLLAPIFPTWIGLTPSVVSPSLAVSSIGLQISSAAIGIAVWPGLISFLARRTTLEAIPWAVFGLACLLLVTQRIVFARASTSGAAADQAVADQAAPEPAATAP